MFRGRVMSSSRDSWKLAGIQYYLTSINLVRIVGNC